MYVCVPGTCLVSSEGMRSSATGFQMAVSCLVGSGDQTQVLYKNNKQLLTTIHSSAPPTAQV